MGSTNGKSSWQRLRLAVLLAVLGSVAVYAWRTRQWSSGLEVAQRLLHNEENRQAIAALDGLRGRFGDSAQIRLLLASAYRQLGNKDAFNRQLELGESMGLSAETVQAEELLFDAQLGLLDAPEARIATYMESNPQAFDTAARSLVFGLLRNQDTQAVDRFLPLWQTQSPDAPWIPTFRAMMQLTRRDWKNALLEIEPALKKHPGFVPVYLKAGIAYRGDQQLELAESMLDRYLESQPDNAEALLMYSEVLRKLGKATEALDRIEKAIESLSDPSRQIQPSLTLQIAKLYFDAEQNQRVIDTLDRLSKLWPEDVEIASTLSQAYQRLGDESRSVAYA
ncbi:MAG: tetratricopeptide repeat protein, partial [Planctomycetota bacterium]